MTAMFSWWSLPGGVPCTSRTLVAKLAVILAKRVFSRVVFITDELGAAWAKKEGLEFDEVILALQNIPSNYSHLYFLGKIYSMAQIWEPTVQVDLDAFCWKPFPKDLLDSPVFAEKSMPMSLADVEYVMAHADWIPTYWFGAGMTQLNCGVFGGQDFNSLRSWALEILDMTHRSKGFPSCDGGTVGWVTEQFSLHAKFPSARVLCPDGVHPLVPFTHLIGVKLDRNILQKISTRLATQNYEPNASI